VEASAVWPVFRSGAIGVLPGPDRAGRPAILLRPRKWDVNQSHANQAHINDSIQAEGTQDEGAGIQGTFREHSGNIQ
jgi:hypothetical protein